MAAKELTIKIPVGDWDNEYLEDEPKLTTADDLIALIQNPKYGPQKIGRLAIVGRERGQASADILPANKLLLNVGAAYEISSLIARRKKTVELANGKEIEVREFVAPVRDEEEAQLLGDDQMPSVPSPSPVDNLGHVSVHSKEAATRAADYLSKVVPGHIYGRLKIIATNNGDVRAAAESLKVEIDRMVERLG